MCVLAIVLASFGAGAGVAITAIVGGVCGELRFRRQRAADTGRGSEIATDSR